MTPLCVKFECLYQKELACFQREVVTLRDQLQEKVVEMESFAGHLEEIFLTVEVNVTLIELYF